MIEINDMVLLTLREAAEVLRVSTDTVSAWRENYGLPAKKIGKLWYFDKQDIATWLKK